ncbi:hypothetical protein E3P96_03177 [Wallemia ichthyophaga]|nr:hypothetical protein E3P96_03177 [Wallemia ichthyophaga]
MIGGKRRWRGIRRPRSRKPRSSGLIAKLKLNRIMKITSLSGKRRRRRKITRITRNPISSAMTPTKMIKLTPKFLL